MIISIICSCDSMVDSKVKFFCVWSTDNMKKICTRILLNVFIYNEILSTFSSGQDFPRMNEYYSSDGIETAKCDYLNCQKSKLLVVQIELLLNSFNERLNIFAQSQNLSNAYKLHWSKFLAQLAQNKSGKCLPVTHRNASKLYSLRDNQSLKNVTESSHSVVELDVVIGERTHEDEDSALFKSRMVEDFTDLFFSSTKDLLSRVSNKHVGCGYVYMEKGGTINDRLLCIFGFMFVGKRKFTALKGIACSKCDIFYQNDLNPNDGMIISKNTTWNCDQSFPYLCTDSQLRSEPIEAGPYVPHCLTVDAGSKKIIYKDGRYDAHLLTDTEMTQWPCLPILIPMMVIIIIFFVLAVYHFVTALKMRYFNNQL